MKKYRLIITLGDDTFVNESGITHNEVRNRINYYIEKYPSILIKVEEINGES